MINPQDFIHHEDEAARQKMEAIPGFAVRVREILKWCDTEHYHRLMENISLLKSEKNVIIAGKRLMRHGNFVNFAGQK